MEGFHGGGDPRMVLAIDLDSMVIMLTQGRKDTEKRGGTQQQPLCSSSPLLTTMAFTFLVCKQPVAWILPLNQKKAAVVKRLDMLSL